MTILYIYIYPEKYFFYYQDDCIGFPCKAFILKWNISIYFYTVTKKENIFSWKKIGFLNECSKAFPDNYFESSEVTRSTRVSWLLQTFSLSFQWIVHYWKQFRSHACLFWNQKLLRFLCWLKPWKFSFHSLLCGRGSFHCDTWRKMDGICGGHFNVPCHWFSVFSSTSQYVCVEQSKILILLGFFNCLDPPVPWALRVNLLEVPLQSLAKTWKLWSRAANKTLPVKTSYLDNKKTMKILNQWWYKHSARFFFKFKWYFAVNKYQKQILYPFSHENFLVDYKWHPCREMFFFSLPKNIYF